MVNLNNILKNTATLQVHAHWDPIADATYDLHQDSPENIELFDLSPNEPIREYEGDAFNVFLPPSTVSVGDVWELDLDRVIPFLSQFHTGATGELRHGEKGAFACLRALSPDYADITFRIHAEFTLATRSKPESKRRNDDDYMDLARFIPSQFAGRLLINLKIGVICDFSLALPPRNSNVDINDFGYADMVFVPRMKLHTTSTKARDDIDWESSLTSEEARKRLELKFYKFAEIDWLPLVDAVEKVTATQRPMHAVISWGPLDDESC
ncbi:MAG: hypothetical protein OXU23_09475 [Candidatus Poribacteria bacterium]|nr:hypothetical protein [Candidatus Poribacteria bacterium]